MGSPVGNGAASGPLGTKGQSSRGGWVTPVFLCLTSCSALQKEEVREFLKEKWARWRDIFCQQPLEKIR